MWPWLHTHTIYMIHLSNDKPAICRMWWSAWCQAQGETPRRNASLAFRLERLQKLRYGVPPLQKVPVWRSGAFRLSLSTGGHDIGRCMLASGWGTHLLPAMQKQTTAHTVIGNSQTTIIMWENNRHLQQVSHRAATITLWWLWRDMAKQQLCASHTVWPMRIVCDGWGVALWRRSIHIPSGPCLRGKVLVRWWWICLLLFMVGLDLEG